MPFIIQLIGYTTIKDHVDYLLYSCYDWGSGSTPHAISDINNCVPI